MDTLSELARAKAIIRVTCQACSRIARVWPGEVLRRHPPDKLLSDVPWVCRCGARNAEVHVIRPRLTAASQLPGNLDLMTWSEIVDASEGPLMRAERASIRSADAVISMVLTELYKAGFAIIRRDTYGTARAPGTVSPSDKARS